MKATTRHTYRIALYLVWLTAILLVVLTFSPVLLQPGKIEPKFLSLPFTLWAGMVATLLMVALTYLATRIRKKL